MSLEVIKLPKYNEDDKGNDSAPTAAILEDKIPEPPQPPPHPLPPLPVEKEIKQEIKQEIKHEKKQEVQIIENPLIDNLDDPNVDEEHKKISMYKTQCRRFPQLVELYPISNLKTKTLAEVEFDISAALSMRMDQLLFLRGFRFLNGFVETAVNRTGAVDITGYSDMVIQNPEIRELLDIIQMQRCGFLKNLSPEMKLMSACVLTAVTVAQINAGKKEMKNDFKSMFAKKPAAVAPPESKINNNNSSNTAAEPKKPLAVEIPFDYSKPYVVPLNIDLSAPSK
jgi:hypothetical protein